MRGTTPVLIAIRRQPAVVNRIISRTFADDQIDADTAPTPHLRQEYVAE